MGATGRSSVRPKIPRDRRAARTSATRASAQNYELNVFVNCPFDEQFRAILWAIVFAIHDCGFIARSALEISDSGQVRIDKITRLIATCKLGLHDLSRTELDPDHGLPRFNMPLELGLFLGAKWLGSPRQRTKICLVLDRERYRYQKYCSDISGQDIASHADQPEEAIRAVRNWLKSVSPDVTLPGGKTIWERYQQFTDDLPLYCEALRLEPADLTFSDFTTVVVAWQRENAW